MYVRFVCEIREQKEDPNRTRMTVSGNKIHYAGEQTAPVAQAKLLINSVLLWKNAKFCTFDLENFYLGTPPAEEDYEYLRIKIADIPQEIINEYDLKSYAHNGWVYVEVCKAAYRLPQAGKLANNLLTKRLIEHGFYPAQTTPGLWRHKTRPIMFCLVVDDFGVEYVGKKNAKYLLRMLKKYYNVQADWTGKKFIGIDLDWNYAKRTCQLAIKIIFQKNSRNWHTPYLVHHRKPHISTYHRSMGKRTIRRYVPGRYPIKRRN